MIDYKKKFINKRFELSSITGRTFNEEMESDRGRAINSAAVRRLQQKAQVFPLETNSAVRSRLTHSLEVQQTGRYLAKTILEKMKAANDLSKFGLDGFEDGFISTVEIACLLHDIGNPPFGHFGEQAINEWAVEYLKKRFLNFSNKQLTKKLVDDLCHFEGNAQAIRALHQLQGLNLTYVQLASILKYTRAAYEKKPIKGKYKYRKKKPGFYFSEEDLVKDIWKSVSVENGNRFPLVYIMEAADDISYCISDLDDAVEKGVITIDQIKFCLQEQLNEENCSFVQKILDEAIARDSVRGKFIETIRVKFVNGLVEKAANVYLAEHEEIFTGRFDNAIIDHDNDAKMATEYLKKIASKYVFNDREVEELELKGFSAIYGILNIYSKVIDLNYEEFTKVIGDSDKSFPVERRLYHRLPESYKEIYNKSVGRLSENSNFKLLELYYRVRLIIDYVSGMTDIYALEKYKSLSASI